MYHGKALILAPEGHTSTYTSCICPAINHPATQHSVAGDAAWHPAGLEAELTSSCLMHEIKPFRTFSAFTRELVSAPSSSENSTTISGDHCLKSIFKKQIVFGKLEVQHISLRLGYERFGLANFLNY